MTTSSTAPVAGSRIEDDVQARGVGGVVGGRRGRRHGRDNLPNRMAVAGTPVLCGHRGSGKGVVAGRRENTPESFAAAVGAGLRWVEIDARLTADGELVA